MVAARPVADDAIAVIDEMDLRTESEYWRGSPWSAAIDRQEVVEFARGRLGLSAERDPEVDALLGTRPEAEDYVTFWWHGTAP